MLPQEDALKRMNKDRAVNSFIRLRGTDRFKPNTLSAEQINDLGKIQGKLNEFKGSKSFFNELLMGARNVKGMVNEESRAICDEVIEFANSVMERIGDKQLAGEEDVEKAHKFIDQILAELIK